MKDGKDHRYFSIVENQRISADKTVQRTVLYLGEINDQQQASWRKTLAVFDEEKQQFTELSLFPEDRPLPEDALDHRSLNIYTMMISSILYFQRNTTGAALISSKYW